MYEDVYLYMNSTVILCKVLGALNILNTNVVINMLLFVHYGFMKKKNQLPNITFSAENEL